ncbi:MAG: homoserine O-acetyltransferase [Chloroflexi bacterium]|nr:homoserine O-acetyltransferase [Chloroflexota bacterium]
MNEEAEPGSVGVVSTQVVDLSAPLPLDVGTSLLPVRLAYETYGKLTPARDNVVLICHALSGDAHAAGWSAALDTPTALDGIGAEERGVRARGGLGWWDGMIGPGKAFDTTRYYVICSNLIGGCRGSTGPGSTNPATGTPYGLDFPVVTVGDMVRAERGLLDQLGVERLLAVTGGSLGGMQALAWAVAYPNDVRAIIPIATTAHLGAQGLAWNAIARSAIMADPDWQGGRYYGTGRAPRAGIGVARMVGHVTYLSRESMKAKFDRRLQSGDQLSFDVTGADYAVESYLRHQAATFAARFDANSYLYLSRALTYFDLARDYGQGSLERALAGVRARSLLISYSSDWLYPPADSAEIAEALRAVGAEVESCLLETSYGHDSFLLEEARQTPVIADFLERCHLAEA